MSYQLQRQVQQLKRRILDVGSLVESAIANTISALINRDESVARKVIAQDAEIDSMEVDVEEDCLKILALYQPVAVDLRFVVAVLKINNDLERMGDLCKNIAKRVLKLTRSDGADFRSDFRQMAIKAQDMVKRSLDALVNADAAMAHRVRHDDDDLDAMRRSIHAKILEALQERPDETDTLMMLDSVARHLERLGDMATNVAEDVIYMVEGSIVRHQQEEE